MYGVPLHDKVNDHTAEPMTVKVADRHAGFEA
jgi:hypothetical protein